jgi:hypothetical protein
MRRDNAAGGNWSGMFRRGLAGVGKHVLLLWQARRDGTAKVQGEMESQRGWEPVGWWCVDVVWRVSSSGGSKKRGQEETRRIIGSSSQ